MRKILRKPKKNDCFKLNPMAHFVQPRIKMSVLLLALLFTGALFISCSGGGSSGGGSSTSDLSSYTMPTEISAVPVDTDAADASASFNRSFISNLRALSRAATDAGTDYSEAEARKYVEEHSLEQFAILESVLNALSQTNYTDEIGNGPYKAMVAFQDEAEGTSKKSLEAWVCQSDAVVDDDGTEYLRARAWIIEEDDEGEDELIKAEFKIYSPPTKNEDGSYADYGEWDLNVKFGEDGTEDFFAASCEVNADGVTVLKVHEKFLESGPASETEVEAEMMGIMYRSGTEGYGKVQYPDWEELWGPDADPNITELTPIFATYAYNEDYLAVKDGDDPTVYKDRLDIVEMTHRYGVYNADTGEDVMKSKSFGFPIYWTTAGGSTKRAYYGAWQGRHQLWTQDGNPVAEGTQVTREDFDPSSTPETYTVGKTFNGVLSRRTYVDASLDDIKGIAVELWVDTSYNLTYNAGNWYHCPQMNWEAFPPACATTPVDFDAEIGLASLAKSATDSRKQVMINGWDQTNNENKTYVYELASAANGETAGFYEATMTEGEFGPVVTANTPRQLLNTNDVTQLWIWVGGSIYVQYTGDTSGGKTGWVEKELVNFDQRTWTPEFGDNNKDYKLPENRELYINMKGSNYVVRKETGQAATCKLELQTAVTPGNATDVVPDGTVFSDPWNDANSTYELITDPADDNYLMLVYTTIGDNDKDQNGQPNEGVEIGGVVGGSVWGIEADIDGQTVAFNWEYSAEGGWGSVSYLKNVNGSYKLLDDPLRFETITALNGAGIEKTLALQYDGWMMGLPDLYQELEKNDWTISDEIADKIINLPAGTQVTDVETGTNYLLKPLETSQFLKVTADTTGLPDITAGQNVDLSTVPDFVEHGMGDIPTDVDLLYSEGKPVE
ncbi:MAG: hypothetical protein JSW26_03915 [Desulfobacterales bacterium]|nr:MAG: hypothetical protein JSW26_03915 [Desulfobacterales bacterium]